MANEDTEKSYWDSVKQEALDAWEQSEHDPEQAQEALHENCDGSYWVIYYHAAALTLRYSRNEDAIFDACWDDAGEAFSGCDSMGAVQTRAAAYAYLADCQEALQDLIDEHESADDESEDN